MLEPEVKSLLLKNLQLAEENNRLLHGMRRRAFWGGVFKFILWVGVIFGLPFALYYFYLAPYVAGIQEAYGNAQQNISELGTFTESIRNFFGSIGSK